MTAFPVAICQAAPVPLNFEAGIAKAAMLAGEAMEQGAKLVAFGETFLGGYPLWLDEAPGAALWDHPGSKALIHEIPDEALNKGGSQIIAPDSRVLGQAGEGEETLHAEMDLSEIASGLASLDTDGHYSRPDVFELSVDTRPMDGVRWNG